MDTDNGVLNMYDPFPLDADNNFCHPCGEDWDGCTCLDGVEEPEPHSIDDPWYFGIRKEW
jgi:hypothetical protein